MSSSLHQLLAEEGIPKLRDKHHNQAAVPIYRNPSSSSSTTNKNTKKLGSSARNHQPVIDQVATEAVISILSGYVGRYLKDHTFRQVIRHKCCSNFKHSKKNDYDNGALTKLELGIQSVEKLVDSHGSNRIEILKNSIKLLTSVASLNSQHSRNGEIPKSIISASAQFYMAVVYKIEKNDRICARHLLQVFCDSPLFARTRLLPDLWDQFFLPHILHLKIWYAKEMEMVLCSDSGDKEEMKQSLSKAYNDQMDWGTAQFAFYYKQWLKVGTSNLNVPRVPLPVRPSYNLSRRTSISSSSTARRSLYSAVFGPDSDVISTDFGYQNDITFDAQQTYEEGNFSQCKELGTPKKVLNQSSKPAEVKLPSERRKVSSFQFLNCQTVEPAECLESGQGKKKLQLASSDLSKAIRTICSSNNLNDCEVAIRIIAKAWLESHGDPVIQNSLSKPPVIIGMLEILFGSDDDEILELAVSLLAELVSRKNMLREVILNSDPQLEIFMKLLKSSSLFLKASVLLHLLKPTAKQMMSADWIPLSLRVLEFGYQLQTLFTVRSSPEAAAFYFLEQLLTGFNEDKNSENARQLVSVGGLSLLVKRMEIEDIYEKYRVASIIYNCLRADGSCRNYLVSNLNVPALFELLIFRNSNKTMSCAIALVTELLCVNRISSRTILLSGLLDKGVKMNLMQILFVRLHRALPEEQLFVAVLLLQLDLLGDPSKYSIYREEAVDTIIGTLDRRKWKEDLQGQAARALLILGGRFMLRGESSIEKWLLKRAGFISGSSASSHGMSRAESRQTSTDEEEDATETWQRKVSIALFSSGKERLMASLSDAMASCVPALARASLITVSWMTIYLSSIPKVLRSMAVSTLMPQLFKCLKYERDDEERVLASLSILNLAKSSDCVSMLPTIEDDVMSLLESLSSVTWTASELIPMISSNSR